MVSLLCLCLWLFLFASGACGGVKSVTFLGPPTQTVEVGEGEEAVLECGVQGLASIHMVSWLRVGHVQVLAVGDLVFSSDWRLSVVSLTRRWQNVQVWILRIAGARPSDSGLYQCQVNTEPTISRSIKLIVRPGADGGMRPPEKVSGVLGSGMASTGSQGSKNTWVPSTTPLSHLAQSSRRGLVVVRGWGERGFKFTRARLNRGQVSDGRSPLGRGEIPVGPNLPITRRPLDLISLGVPFLCLATVTAILVLCNVFHTSLFSSGPGGCGSAPLPRINLIEPTSGDRQDPVPRGSLQLSRTQDAGQRLLQP